MNPVRLQELLEGLGHPRVLIVGDLILDRYVTGDVQRISPEAPIPVLRGTHLEERLGGAGNVAVNLRAMEAQVEILGVVGADDEGQRQLELLAALGVDTGGCVRDGQRPSTVKTRLVSGVQQMLRVDWEDARPLGEGSEAELVRAVAERAARFQAIVLSDYGKGVLTTAVVRSAIDAARRAGVPILVDPKGRDYVRYRGATLITPNRKEAEEALGHTLEDLGKVEAAAVELMELAALDATVITLGSEGIYYRSSAEALGGTSEGHVTAVAREVFDVTGAGDTVIAHLALALGAGLDLESAVHLANQAAGIVVGRRGAASVRRSELAQALGAGRAVGKLYLRQDLPRAIAQWRSEGKRIVFTNGCFDILHVGHVDYLRFARSRGDVLVVAVNDDDSVRRLKGPERPIHPLRDRMEVLAALEMVDAVAAFGEDTPQRIIEELTPDVLVKGEDWRDKGVVGREWVERHGGEVHLAPLVPRRSTSAIVEKLREGG